MRLSISGTSCLGKSTFVHDFLEEWPMYTAPDISYRDLLSEKGLPHSKATNEDTQWAILNCMIDEMQKYDKDSKVIFDRCPLDNLVYTMYAYSRDNVSSEFVNKCIPLVRESIKSFDIMLFVPVTKVSPVEIEDDGTREIDPDYNTEIDHLFKAMKYDWDCNHESKIFDPRDKPAIIEIFGSPLERIQMAKLYLNVDGDIIDNTGILTEEEIRQAENLKQQFGIETDSTLEILEDPKGKNVKYK